MTGEKLVDRKGNIRGEINTQNRSWKFQNNLKWNLILDDMYKQAQEKVVTLHDQQLSIVPEHHGLEQGELYHHKEEIKVYIPPEPPPSLQKPLVQNNIVPSLKPE